MFTGSPIEDGHAGWTATVQFMQIQTLHLQQYIFRGDFTFSSETQSCKVCVHYLASHGRHTVAQSIASIVALACGDRIGLHVDFVIQFSYRLVMTLSVHTNSLL